MEGGTLAWSLRSECSASAQHVGPVQRIDLEVGRHGLRRMHGDRRTDIDAHAVPRDEQIAFEARGRGARDDLLLGGVLADHVGENAEPSAGLRHHAAGLLG